MRPLSTNHIAFQRLNSCWRQPERRGHFKVYIIWHDHVLWLQADRFAKELLRFYLYFNKQHKSDLNESFPLCFRPSSHTPPVTNPTHSGTSSAPKCPLCCAPFNRPKVLHECFCVFCQTCLEKVQDHPDKITCPKCRKETSGLSHGVAGLLSDTGLIDFLLNR